MKTLRSFAAASLFAAGSLLAAPSAGAIDSTVMRCSPSQTNLAWLKTWRVNGNATYTNIQAWMSGPVNNGMERIDPISLYINGKSYDVRGIENAQVRTNSIVAVKSTWRWTTLWGGQRYVSCSRSYVA